MMVRGDGSVHVSLNVLTWPEKKLIILSKFPRVIQMCLHIIVYLDLKTILPCKYFIDLKDLHVWELQI